VGGVCDKSVKLMNEGHAFFPDEQTIKPGPFVPFRPGGGHQGLT
jgi:hypothetical protein